MEESDNPSDPLDQASRLEELTTAYLLAQQLGKSNPEQYSLPNGQWPTTDCVDCDLPIEAGRLTLGKVRCFHCQSDKEKREARGLR